MPTMNQQVSLPDGRRIGYNEYGAPGGRPVFYLHGTPSARVEWEVFGTDELARESNLRLIALDRPGMGLSDFQPGRRIGDWPADLAALADRLSLERFGVLGFSGGTVYATACAQKIPERITSVVLAGVVGPFDVPGLTDGIPPQNLQYLQASLARPGMARNILRMMGMMARLTPQRFVAQAMQVLPPPDQAVLASPAGSAGFVRMFRESVRQGPRGAQLDTALMLSPWDFDPAGIRIPVHMWKGELDQNAPLAMAHYLAGIIPEARLCVYPQDGHLSIMANHLREMLEVFRAG